MYGANTRRERWTLTDQRLGAMAALLTRFSVAFAEERGVVPQVAANNVRSPNGSGSGDQGAESSTTFSTTSGVDDVSKDYLTMVEDMEKHALYVRSCFAWSLFIVFWIVSRATVLFSFHLTLRFRNMYIDLKNSIGWLGDIQSNGRLVIWLVYIFLYAFPTLQEIMV